MEDYKATDRIRELVARLAGLHVDAGLLSRIEAVLPDNYQEPGHWAELAAVLRRQRNYRAAQAVYDSALSVHAGSALLWNNYGTMLRDWGKLDQALAAFDRAITLDERYSKPLENRAKVLEMAHRFAEARQYYQASLVLDPINPSAMNNIGVCYVGEHAGREAEIWFRLALEADPEFTDSLFNLAAVLLDRRNHEAAQEQIDTLARLLPDDPEVEALRRDLAPQGSSGNGTPAVAARRSLDGEGIGRILDLCYELAGNPRSVFISYAWADEATRRFAIRLSEDLTARSFKVALDRNYDFEVYEVLTLLAFCQNVVMLNDIHYAESCLLGKVAITKPTFPYPSFPYHSFAFPADSLSEDYLGEVLKISAVTWEMARQLKKAGDPDAAQTALELVRPEAFQQVPGLRIFIEGWRVDEAQMVLLNSKRYRSISVAYLGGGDCLAGFPLYDFSDESFYTTSFDALARILELGGQLPAETAPITMGRPDWRAYRWPNSEIVSATLWKSSGTPILVWRPSLTDTGKHAAILSRFLDWEPVV